MGKTARLPELGLVGDHSHCSVHDANQQMDTDQGDGKHKKSCTGLKEK